MLGTAVAQILPLIIMPVLTRLYSEEEFGVFSTFLAYSVVLIVAASGRYHVAILLPKENDEALKVFSLSNTITLYYSLFLLVFSFIIYFVFESPLNKSGLIFLIPFYVCFFGLWQSLYNLLIRLKKFNKTAISKVIQSIGYTSTSSVIGLFFTTLGLAIGKIVGIISAYLFLAKNDNIYKNSFPFAELKSVALKYIDYPKYSLLPAFLDTLSLQALIILIGYYYTELELGYFGLTNMCFAAPLALIGTSFRDVFYQRITFLINQDKINLAKAFFLKSSLILAVLGIVISATLLIGGEFLFSFVFGEKWTTSGLFASILALSLAIRLTVSPLSSVLYATGNVKTVSIWQTTYFITTFSVLFTSILVYKLDIYNLLKVYVCHELVLYSLYYYLQYNSLNKLMK